MDSDFCATSKDNIDLYPKARLIMQAVFSIGTTAAPAATTQNRHGSGMQRPCLLFQ